MTIDAKVLNLTEKIRAALCTVKDSSTALQLEQKISCETVDSLLYSSMKFPTDNNARSELSAKQNKALKMQSE